ncbi:MAG: protein kinase domain-containing protein [Planctomycetota bacterium]|jgi:serine/threonine-protein kinase
MTELNDNLQEGALDQAVQKFVDARLRGEQPDIDEFVKRYPELENQIRQKVRSLQKIDTLFGSLVQAEEGDFEDTATGCDLTGQKLAHFEICEMIGRGGMGVVYLARDTKLDRSVAIKRLPAELQASSTARTRFTREAKLLASLSHPNIGVIHDIVEPTEGDAYLVLEYISGETLAERMAREPLGLNEALSIALQIAQGVCAAHEAGVIHRDLKPSNIKITPDGRVKVLDFGLAKTTISKSAAPDPTVTQAGGIMGTPAYMSPEQARGKPMDRRTDIWSFGCLLHEMLTGHLPFEGETTTDVLARIIEREPDWGLLPQATPSNIRVLLWRCLLKDPGRRLQHMGDAVIEIDETLNVPPDKPSVGEPEIGVSRQMLWWLAAACSFAGLFVGLIVNSLFLNRSVAPSLSRKDPVSISRTHIRLPEDQVLGFFQSATSGIRQPAFDLSPDGSRLVYAAYVGGETQLFERMIDQYEIRPIPGTERASSPFFSPDGQSVGFFAEGMLKVVRLQGGEPRMLCNAGSGGGGWSDDDMIYFMGEGGLSRVPASGGSIEEQGIKFDYFWGYMQVLPGSEAVIFSSLRDGAVHVSLETMQKKVLERDVLYAHYVPTGHLVYVRAGAIEAVPFDLTTLKKTGPSVPVIPRILSDSVYGSAQFAFSNNGSLVYVPGGDTAKSTLVWVDRQGNEEQLPTPAQNYGTFKLSPDGTKLAIVINELQSNVYIYDIAKNERFRLTLEGQNTHPIWAPDGKRVTFDRRMEGEGNSNILWQPADGSREAEVLYSSQHYVAPFSWSPNGKLLAFVQVRPNSEYDIWGLKLEGDGEPELIVGTKFIDHFPAFSPPDGRWLTYTSNREGTSKVYVRPYPALNQTITISDDSGEEPIWSPKKGDELFYRSGNKWVVASIATEPEFTVEKRQVLFEGSYINIGGLSYDVAPDGQRLLVLKPQFDDSQVRELHVVFNWFEELKGLVPTEKE